MIDLGCFMHPPPISRPQRGKGLSLYATPPSDFIFQISAISPSLIFVEVADAYKVHLQVGRTICPNLHREPILTLPPKDTRR